ncbi:transcriptional regulator [Microbacterium faecale]|uniref:Transcriptional regulator n=1 Tax=Microbacterium faecale TaxID=1804630 RepID=A0A917DHY2_9MICO|nr:helix-turn-helix transcriptional regulator [Microbacterium faecale]GGD41892.1 transcriptional regulator [Microbacterium faecale]
MEASEFGHLVHRWRDRLAPDDVGLTAGLRRRAPGLRREELAQLAGLSVDYIVRLERGRATRPSAQVVASLARALQLSGAERDALFISAGLLPPRDGMVSDFIPAGVQRLVSRLGDAAVGVFAADWSLLIWNPTWATLHGPPGRLPETERNLARAIFGDGAAHRSLRPSPPALTDDFERSIVADLKHARARYPSDRRLASLVRELRAVSADFARHWNDAAPAEHTSSRKTIKHPKVGAITLDCDVLSVPGADLRIVAYTAAADTTDENKLDLLRVTGAA